MTSTNNLNGVPNFGYGLPEEPDISGGTKDDIAEGSGEPKKRGRKLSDD